MTWFYGITGRLALGYWLYRHRQWGMAPLLAAGLLLNLHFFRVSSASFMLVAGAIGILFGTLLRIVCYTFVGTHDPLGEPHTGPLIIDGPYAVTRNPVYLGEAGIVLGVAMMSRMPWFVLATLLGYMVVTAFVIEWEEETLRVRYGSEYEEYCRIVPRWFSLRRFVHADTYLKTKGRVKLMAAIRAEAGTLLLGLLSILAFLAKADIEIFFMKFFNP
jgi:protein-S-isoprenylcysteine O-methyltransferase Ste14